MADARTPAMTGGTYLRIRREAAGRSIDEVAQICVGDSVALTAAIAALELAEADREILPPADLYRLQAAFRFVPSIYQRLVQDMPVPALCRLCGCSWDDACLDAATGAGCAWTDASKSLCSCCAELP